MTEVNDDKNTDTSNDTNNDTSTDDMNNTTVDFLEFHRSELPRRLSQGNASLAAEIMTPGRSFSWILTNGQTATYQMTATGMEILTDANLDKPDAIKPDATPDVAVEISPEDWSDYARELKSCFALLYTDAVRMKAGTFNHFAAWEPTLLAAYFGRPIYDHPPELLDRQGRPLDINRSFTLDENPDEISHFLRTAGFAVFRGVFAPSEIQHFSDIADEAMAVASPDDLHSWWATKKDGTQVCCRVTYLNEKYETIRALQHDDRLRRIADFSGEDLTPNPDRLDGYNVVIKHGEAIEGLSDLPWHRDCGMGGHPVLCPGINIGIQLDAANKKSGQLHFLAGSHHHSNREMGVKADWPTVAVDTQPGDVTAHFGHVMHSAPPPEGQGMGRRVLYTSFKQEILDDYVPAGKGYNDVLFQHDGGRVRSPEEVQTARGSD